MQMKIIAALALATTMLASPVYASGKHAGGHGDEMAIGKPGKAANVTRTIHVSMVETDDGKMLFEPARIEIKKGETVRFELGNTGEVDHEFVMDTPKAIEEHKALMEKFPEMEHADPNAARVAPGDAVEIVWTFTKAGKFQFACLIPGHYEMGMVGPITVASK